ncbi:MAG: hypothetical protein ACT4O5_18155 [Gammaproteobacteria bacterium]
MRPPLRSGRQTEAWCDDHGDFSVQYLTARTLSAERQAAGNTQTV